MKKTINMLAIIMGLILIATPAQAMNWSWPSLSVTSILTGLKSAADFVVNFKIPFTQSHVGLGTATAVVVPTYIATKVLVPSRHQTRIRTVAILGVTAAYVCKREVDLYRELEAIKSDTTDIKSSVSSLRDDVAGIKRDMAKQKEVNSRFDAVDRRLGELVTPAQLTAQLKAQEATLLAATNGARDDLAKFRKETAENFVVRKAASDMQTFSINQIVQEHKKMNAHLTGLTTNLAATRTAISAAVSDSENRLTNSMNAMEKRLTQLITQQVQPITGLVTGGHSTAAAATNTPDSTLSN